MSDTTVKVGAPADTGPTYTVTINRDSTDTITDWTTATTVQLVLPDGTLKTVTKTSATAGQWIGTVKYAAWFTTIGQFRTHAKATFADSTVLTIPDGLNFLLEG